MSIMLKYKKHMIMHLGCELTHEAKRIKCCKSTLIVMKYIQITAQESCTSTRYPHWLVKC